MNSIGLVLASHQLTQDSLMTADVGTLGTHLYALKHLHHLCTLNSQVSNYKNLVLCAILSKCFFQHLPNYIVVMFLRNMINGLRRYPFSNISSRLSVKPISFCLIHFIRLYFFTLKRQSQIITI